MDPPAPSANERVARSRPWLDAALFLPLAAIAAYVAASTIWLAMGHHVPYPYWDHWMHLLPSESLAHPTAQANEHRILFGRLFFVIDTLMFGGRGHFSLAVSIVSLATTAALVAVAAVRGPAGRRNWLPVVALGIALLLSAYAWDTFLWPFNVSYVGVCPAAVGAILLATRPQLTTRALAGAALLSFVAVYSLASGLLVLPLVTAIAAIRREPGRRLIELSIVSGFFFFLYFGNYVTPGQHDRPTATLGHVVDVLRYLSVFIGAPLTLSCGSSRLLAANFTGWVGLVGLGVLMGARIRARRTLPPSAWALPFVALFCVGWGFLAALGRQRFGIESATWARYGTPALLFWFALLSDGLRISQRWLARAPIAVLATTLSFVLAHEQESLEKVGIGYFSRFPDAETALLSGAFEKRIVDGISPAPRFVLDATPVLRENHWNVFADDWAGWLGEPLGDHLSTAPPGACVGYLDEVSPVAAYLRPAFHAQGWAYDTDGHRPIERLLLVDADDIIVGYAVGGQPRGDVPQIRDDVRSPSTGFVGHVGDIHQPKTEIHAVGLLPEGRGCPIGPPQQITHRGALRLVERL